MLLRSIQKQFMKRNVFLRSFSEEFQIIEGFATPQETQQFCNQFCEDRPTSIIRKQALTASSLGYGSGNVRLFEDNWSGVMQRAVNTGCNVIQMDVREKHLKENFDTNPAGYNEVSSILNSILYTNNIKREALIIQGRIFTHDSQGNPYSPKDIQRQINILINSYKVTTLDSVTLQMPPFITDSQLCMVLSYIQREIHEGHIRGYYIGSNSIDINNDYIYTNMPQGSKIKTNNNINLYKLVKMASDMHLIDSFLGIQIPVNILEKQAFRNLESLNSSRDASEKLTAFSEYIYDKSIEPSMNLFELCECLDLHVLIDRGFETNGHRYIRDKQTNKITDIYRPTRFFEVEQQENKELDTELQECIDICRYMEQVYGEEVKEKYKEQSASLPAAVSFTQTVVETLTGCNNLCIFEDLNRNKILPELRDIITDICNCEEAKKWAFAYRISIQSLINLYKRAYKGREYLYLQKISASLDHLCPSLNIYKDSIYKRVLEIYLSTQNSIIYTDNIYMHEKGISKTRVLTKEEQNHFIKQYQLPQEKL
ncbi:hypothetical protein WA158_006023 [Blastocystis sp. Blastoise]